MSFIDTLLGALFSMASLRIIVVGLTTCLCLTQAAGIDSWRSQSIYQLVTDRFARTDGSTTASCDPAQGIYCGGTFQGIINKLDYIQDLGFSAIWISPVTYQMPEMTADLSAYHGYWQQDLYRINPPFGTPEDLVSLSNELHKREMYLMVDVVPNHVAFAGNGNVASVDYSRFNPFNDEKYFHPFKLQSSDPWNETCAEVCWLGDTTVLLPDIRTEDDDVVSMFHTWISQLVSNYSIDGLRIDSIFNVNPSFLAPFNNASGVYCIGEGATNLASSLCPLSYDLDGVINYPMYYALTSAFGSPGGSIQPLLDGLDSVKSSCADIFTMGLFIENHDVPRFASHTSDMALARNAITYNLIGDGIPILYYGAEQHLSGGANPFDREALWLTGYPTNVPLVPLVQSLNRLRSFAAGNSAQCTANTATRRNKAVIRVRATNSNTTAGATSSNSSTTAGTDYLTSSSVAIYNGTNTVAFRKGCTGNQVISVMSSLGSNPGSSPEAQLTLQGAQTGFGAQESVTEILSCQTETTDALGNLQVSLNDGGPRVFYPTASLGKSGLCGH